MMTDKIIHIQFKYIYIRVDVFIPPFFPGKEVISRFRLLSVA